MAQQNDIRKLFKHGDDIVFSSEPTDFFNPEIRDLFRKITDDDLDNIEVGSIVWWDGFDLPNGKVYGYTAIVIGEVWKDDGLFDIFDENGEIIVCDNHLYIVDNLEKLSKLIKQNPKAKEVYAL